MSSINLSEEARTAMACAQGLRSAAVACAPSQNVLKARLILCADQLEKLATLALRQQDKLDVLDGALRECLQEMHAWDRMEDCTSSTRAAIARAERALGVTP